MERLWSPWRSEYIESISAKENADKSGKDDGAGKTCIFCGKFSEQDDAKNLVIYRGKLSAIIMNLYPYNSGHLLIVPYAHKATFEELTPDENVDVMSQVGLAIKALRMISHPDGFNFGANLGKVSGAGIADHVHFHVVPRWNGDTNFMTSVGDIRIISEELNETFKKLTNVLAAIKP